MGRGGLLLVSVVACWASLAAALGPAAESAEAGVGPLLYEGAGSAPAGLRWPYAYAPAALYKRLPAQYNFGLGKRASKLYSFGLGKRAADYDDDQAEVRLARVLLKYYDSPQPRSVGLPQSEIGEERPF